MTDTEALRNKIALEISELPPEKLGDVLNFVTNLTDKEKQSNGTRPGAPEQDPILKFTAVSLTAHWRTTLTASCTVSHGEFRSESGLRSAGVAQCSVGAISAFVQSGRNLVKQSTSCFTVPAFISYS